MPRADDVDRLAADEQGVDADDGDPRGAVVEDRGADLAGVVEFGVVRLAVAAGLLHADLRRDVALGEADLEQGGGCAARLRRAAGSAACEAAAMSKAATSKSERTTQIVILRIREALEMKGGFGRRVKGRRRAAGFAFCPMLSDFSSENAEIRCGPRLDFGRFLPMILYLNDPPPLVAEEESSDGQSRPS